MCCIFLSRYLAAFSVKLIVRNISWEKYVGLHEIDLFFEHFYAPTNSGSIVPLLFTLHSFVTGLIGVNDARVVEVNESLHQGRCATQGWPPSRSATLLEVTLIFDFNCRKHDLSTKNHVKFRWNFIYLLWCEIFKSKKNYWIFFKLWIFSSIINRKLLQWHDSFNKTINFLIINIISWFLVI